jgi:hypothetical protein
MQIGYHKFELRKDLNVMFGIHLMHVYGEDPVPISNVSVKIL